LNPKTEILTKSFTIPNPELGAVRLLQYKDPAWGGNVYTSAIDLPGFYGLVRFFDDTPKELILCDHDLPIRTVVDQGGNLVDPDKLREYSDQRVFFTIKVDSELEILIYHLPGDGWFAALATTLYQNGLFPEKHLHGTES
jgi:hypothetical protein